MNDKKDPKNEAKPEPKAKGGLLPSAIALMNLLATGAIGFFVITGANASTATEEGETEGAEAAVEIPPVIKTLDPFVVNLNEEGSSRYLKTKVEFELKDEPAGVTFDNRSRMVRDDILRYLSNLTVEQTLGDKNKDKIRTDTMARVGKILGPEKLKAIYFTEFVVQ